MGLNDQKSGSGQEWWRQHGGDPTAHASRSAAASRAAAESQTLLPLA